MDPSTKDTDKLENDFYSVDDGQPKFENQGSPPAYTDSEYQTQQQLQQEPPHLQANFNTQYSTPYAYSQAYNQSGQPNPSYVQNHNVIVTQPVPVPQVVVTTVSDYMGLAVVSCLCFCCPLGLVAIMKASEARTALQENRVERAKELAKQARLFSILAIVVGIFIAIVGTVVGVVLYNQQVGNN